MNRYCGFNPLRYGDLFINLVACRALRQMDPDSHLTFVLNANYRSAAPLFLDQPDIDRVHITHKATDGFDKEDWQWVNEQRFTHVFNPMQDHLHSEPWWRTGRNQPQEVAYIHRIPLPPGETGKLSLNRWFEPSKGFEKCVAFQPFAGSYDPHNMKQLSPAQAQRVVDLIRARGYQVLQMGLPTEWRLDKVTFIDTDFFGAVKNLLGCRALITTDSGFNWAASCYDHPTLGLYSHAYYGKDRVSAIQPLNPNAIYLDDANVNDIGLESISAALDKLL